MVEIPKMLRPVDLKCFDLLTYRGCRHACKREGCAGAGETADNIDSIAVRIMC